MAVVKDESTSGTHGSRRKETMSQMTEVHDHTVVTKRRQGQEHTTTAGDSNRS